MMDRNPIKLSDLTKQIEVVLQASFGSTSYWILAEISGHKFYPKNDRHYFEFIEKVEDINEPVAKVTGVAWSNGSRQIRIFESSTGQQFTNGLQVLVQVKIEYKSAYGFKLILVDIDPSFTLGNLEKKRRETLIKLVNENPTVIQLINEEYVTKNKNLKFSKALQRIALIGSPNSEGYTDFHHTIRANSFNYKFTIDVYQSSVQGADVEKELVSKLIAIYRSAIKYDCVVIIRGGGAKTDFVVFDNYLLALAVARFPFPIITGIGHHKDVSIVDLMAHTSTKTPTKAAEFIVALNRQFEDELMEMQKGIIIKVQQLVYSYRQLLSNTNLSLLNNSKKLVVERKEWISRFNQVIVNGSVNCINSHSKELQTVKHSIRNNSLSIIYTFNGSLSIVNHSIINSSRTMLFTRRSNLNNLSGQLLIKPRIIAAKKLADLKNVIENISIYSKKYLVNKKGYLGHYDSVIKLLSPDNILKRGFAIIYKEGKVMVNSKNINSGDNITIELYNSEITTLVKSKKEIDGREIKL